MTDRPIIFSAPMIQSLLVGSKTQTRRLAWQPWIEFPEIKQRLRKPSMWQRVQPGHRLWVRENAQLRSVGPARNEIAIAYQADGGMGDVHPHFLVGGERNPFKATSWTPSIHMPRWASRLTLIVAATKIERIREISHDDAVAEGVGIFPHSMSARKRFGELWRSLHGAESCDADSEVVVLSFQVQNRNIDALEAA